MSASGEAFPLRQLYFYLTQGCNQACRHCWLAPKLDPSGDRYPVLPVEAFEQAVQEALPLGLSSVKLTGGEPLLHPAILELVDTVKRFKVGLAVETNGLLCTDKVAAALAEVPGAFVSVSLDGAGAATHDCIRGVPGSFDLATRAVQRLAAVGMRPQVIMSLFPDNVDQIEAMVRLAEKLGAGSVKFNVVQPTARGERLYKRGETLGIGQLLELGHFVERELAPSSELLLFFDYPLAFRPLSRISETPGVAGVCGILGILGVLATGDYALCGIGEHVRDLVFGRVGRDPLEQVWRTHPILCELRAGLPDRLHGICGRCLMKHRCLGSCIAQNYLRSQELWAPNWFCELAEGEGFFPGSRKYDLLDSEQVSRGGRR